jgi:hypothetical protein
MKRSRSIKNWDFFLRKNNQYGKKISYRTVKENAKIFDAHRPPLFSVRPQAWVFARF